MTRMSSATFSILFFLILTTVCSSLSFQQPPISLNAATTRRTAMTQGLAIAFGLWSSMEPLPVSAEESTTATGGEKTAAELREENKAEKERLKQEKAKEEAARRLAAETKQRLAAGRIGTI